MNNRNKRKKKQKTEDVEHVQQRQGVSGMKDLEKIWCGLYMESLHRYYKIQELNYFISGSLLSANKTTIRF